MSCNGSRNEGRERCVFTSIMLLGGLFALSASPCARVPLVSALVIIGVPLMTFGVAAPSRIGLLSEIALLLRGLEAGLLSLLLFAVGRRREALAVRDAHRTRVETSYMASSERMAGAVGDDPFRLHHARRLALFGTVLTVISGLALPLIDPSTYTFGDWPHAPFVFLLDVVTLGLVARVVTERMMVRLFEATWALRENSPNVSRLRATPLTIMLGAALGAVGALVIVSAAAMACAIETSWIVPTANLHVPAFWFIRETAPDGLPLGVMVGSILGAGMGLAQVRRVLPTTESETDEA